MGAAVAGGDAPSVYAGCGRSARVLAAKGVYSSAGVSVSAGVSAAAGLTLGKRYREGESTRAPPPSAPPSPPAFTASYPDLPAFAPEDLRSPPPPPSVAASVTSCRAGPPRRPARSSRASPAANHNNLRAKRARPRAPRSSCPRRPKPASHIFFGSDIELFSSQFCGTFMSKISFFEWSDRRQQTGCYRVIK